MRTSLDIPDPLLRRARKLARDRGTTLRALLIAGLRSVIEQGTTATVPVHRMKDCSFGREGLVPGLSWSDSERMDALIYEDRA